MIDPLTLADGTIVHPDGRVVPPGGAILTPRSVETVAVPTHREAQRLVTSARRKLADLPDVPRNMNTIGLIVAYVMFGLDDEEIAFASGLTSRQVGNIKLTDAYQTMYDEIVRGIISAESGDVRDLFVKHARSAAGTMFDALTASKAADRIKAASDILDRSGFRPNDVVEHRHRLDGGLTIEIVRKDEQSMPVIELQVEDEHG